MCDARKVVVMVLAFVMADLAIAERQVAKRNLSGRAVIGQHSFEGPAITGLMDDAGFNIDIDTQRFTFGAAWSR